MSFGKGIGLTWNISKCRDVWLRLFTSKRTKDNELEEDKDEKN